MKTFNTENVFNSIYSKQEIRYCEYQGWALTTEAGRSISIYVKDGEKIGEGHYEYPLEKKDIFVKETKKRASYLRKKINDEFARRGSDSWYREYRQDELTLDAWYEKVLKEDRKKALLDRDEKKIEDMVKKNVKKYWDHPFRILRTGSHTGTHTMAYGKENSVVCSETNDWKGYSRSTKFPMVVRSLHLTIRRGYSLFVIGGLITFVKGDKIDRRGMACEWIEQGKAIADIRTVKGYLVRGEHIEAKSLKEAQEVSAERRTLLLAQAVAEHKKLRIRNQQKADGTLMITFEDSLKSGNCRPGTASFKHKYEEAIGHEATSISIDDLRKYGKQFGVEYYAERAIRYALSH